MKILEVKHLDFKYNNQFVLKDVNFELTEGEYVGILGPNGGGKSTLLKLILGILPLQKGFIKIPGAKLGNHSFIGYVPQKSSCIGYDFPSKVHELLDNSLEPGNSFMFDRQKQDAKIQQILDELKIDHLKDKLLGELSGGERQKVFIAKSLISSPKILILDEPTAAVDIESESVFYNLIKSLKNKYNLTIILVSHDIAAVSKEVDKVFFLNKTIECFHSGQEFLQEENLDRLYGNFRQLINHHH